MIRFLLSLRYRIKESGLQQITKSAQANKNCGIVFLANHPAEIDPLILLKTLWFPFKVRPVALEFIFQVPIIRYFLRYVGALSIPNFDTSSNSYKRKKIDQVYENIFSLLRKGENILIYPAGGLKNGSEEVIGGASGVHHILEQMPDVNIVLVRTTGLWGSSFSKAITGNTPDLLTTFLHGMKVIIKNGIFFTPKRSVTVTFALPEKDFPRRSSKLELNRYLEHWFNKEGQEPLTLVSYSCWKEDLPKIYTPASKEPLSLDKVSSEIQERVYEEIATLAQKPKEGLHPDIDLARDLGFDSLDLAQINLMLKEQFGALNINSTELTTIGSVMLFAAKMKESATGEQVIEGEGQWIREKKRPPVLMPQGSSLIEAFLHNAERMKEAIACADGTSGQLSYKQLKRAVVALALKIKEVPGEKVGIMLPASVAVQIVILATLLAGKIPVMINWTLGERNLHSVVEQTKMHVTITSWQFLERLENAELGGIEENFLLLEDLKRSFTLRDKIKIIALLSLSRRRLIQSMCKRAIVGTDPAVILFTSGTESVPKGVPLTHQNILSNLRSAYEYVEIQNQDVLLGMLPPFHSFGFSVTGLLPLLAGMKVVYFPNPTDGRGLATIIERWGVTLCCSAPTFLKGMVRAAKKGQLQSLRLVVAGAEKLPAELVERLSTINQKAKIIEGYGITECSPILTLNPPHQPVKGVGRPLPLVELLIVHPESHTPLSQGETGLILARGPNVFGGYLDRSLPSPFLTLAQKQWYETGDLGFLDEEGYLTLVGRLKRFVKIGGEMVSLGAIEEILSTTAVKEGWPIDHDRPSLAITATEEAGEKTKIHLFATFPIDKIIVNEVLRKNGMSNLIKISSVHRVGYLPLLGSGKINYRALTV